MIESHPEVQASSEQIQSILGHLGVVEARRRRLDVTSLSREDASTLLMKLTRQNGNVRVSTGGRPARPLTQLPSHQQKLIAALRDDPSDPRHGTQYAYSAGRCKCGSCRTAGTSRQT